MAETPKRYRALRAEAERLLGEDRVLCDATSTELHSYDASLEAGRPDLVVVPERTADLPGLVLACERLGVPYVVRGAGTGYSGGALAARGGTTVLTRDLDRVIEVDFDEGWMRCEPGVVLARVQELAAAEGWRYVPDPSSYEVCTIGGNLAENAGGPHALAGGPTSNYVLDLEVVRPDGTVVPLDDQRPWDGGLDLRSLVIGSEGTLGPIVSARLRLVRAPETQRSILATYTRQEDAVATVEQVFELGLLPSALDMLTGAFVPGRPSYADPSLLFIALEGRREEVATQAEALGRCVEEHDGRFELLELAAFMERRAHLVRDKVRRMVAASGCPRYYLFDAVAPRSSLDGLMQAIRDAAREYALPVLNTFHAGDGNVHPTPFYDPREPGYRSRLLGFSARVLQACCRLGGSLSGEHGIGLEKLDLMAEFLPENVLEVMRRVRRVFDPHELCNPGKLLPAPTASTPAPPKPSARVGSGAPQGSGVVVNHVDALIEVNSAAVRFADVAVALAGSPYELPYEPLGGTPEMGVLEAIDWGLPALREGASARARDLILGASLSAPGTGTSLELGGRCAKDVAGYELRKLVYGSRGRLGRLRSVRLRLLPSPSDSRLVSSRPLPPTEAVRLCQDTDRAALPFRYLGVLLDAGGQASVVGRMSLQGGRLDRQLRALTRIGAPGTWTVTAEADAWSDPVMRALAAASGQLRGAPRAPWHHHEFLVRLTARRVPAFASVGHRRLWWRGGPEAAAAELSPLELGIIRAFREP